MICQAFFWKKFIFFDSNISSAVNVCIEQRHTPGAVHGAAGQNEKKSSVWCRSRINVQAAGSVNGETGDGITRIKGRSVTSCEGV